MTPGPRERTFAAGDGLELFFRDWGDPLCDRAPLLCLPGLTRNSKDFDALARRESARRRVICPDLRGRGRSAYCDWRRYEPRVYLDDLRQLVAALGLHNLLVVGTSMGGLLGVALAVAMPAALAGLAVNDAGPDIPAAGASRILAYIGADRPQPDWPSAVVQLRSMFKNLSLTTDEDWLAFARNTFREGADGRLHFDWDVNLVRPIRAGLVGEFDLWALWRAIRRLPVLAIRGGVSDILTAETFARMRMEKPDLIQVTVPGVGHAPTLSEPVAREALDDFLGRF